MQFLSSYLGDNKFIQFGALFVALVVVIALMVVLTRVFFARRLQPPGGRGRQARLGIVDAFDLDRHRQLVLIRRDNIEHLIMIGGPSDVVIEASIMRAQTAATNRDKEFAQPAPERPPSPANGAAAAQIPPSRAEPRLGRAPEPSLKAPPAPRMPLAPVVLAPPESAPRPRTPPVLPMPLPPATPRPAPTPAAPPPEPALRGPAPPAYAAPPPPPAGAAPGQRPVPPLMPAPPPRPVPAVAPPPPTPPAPPRPAVVAAPPPVPPAPQPPQQQPQPNPVQTATPPASVVDDPFDSLEAEMAKLLGRK